jgi:hypothetical protein
VTKKIIIICLAAGVNPPEFCFSKSVHIFMLARPFQSNEIKMLSNVKLSSLQNNVCTSTSKYFDMVALRTDTIKLFTNVFYKCL